MALATLGFRLVATIVDQGGNLANLTYNLTPAADFDEATTSAGLWLTRLALVTGSVIKSYTIGEVFDDAVAGYGTGENENIALITAKRTDSSKTVNIRIPNPLNSLFEGLTGPDHNKVDQANADLRTYLSGWESGALATFGPAELTIRDTATVGNFWGHRIHRQSSVG